jgi:SAM-dependent methyltransferase
MARSVMQAVDQHYGRSGLASAIDEALRRAGKEREALSPLDLAPLDHFHSRGREATLELARLAEPGPDTRVLDVGGGLGGPARTLAREIGCRVTVLDLTEEFCRIGRDLTRRTRLEERVSFEHGNALAMPFPDAAFDLAWTQHSSMNVAEKERLYGEVHRVLAPKGRLAMHEIMAGPGGPPHFPVPWARDPAISFLRPPAEVRALLARLGFRELAWRDETELTLRWMHERKAAQPSGPPPPLGLHLLFGADTPMILGNFERSLVEGRVAVVKCLWERA